MSENGTKPGRTALVVVVVLVVLLPTLPFLPIAFAFLELSLFGTDYVEEIFRLVGLHDVLGGFYESVFALLGW